MIGNINHPITSPNLKGYQHIEGIWLPSIWFSEQMCANFIIQYWFKGCQVHRFEQGYLLQFPHARSGYCEQFEGWPLIKFKNQLCSMRVSDNEKEIIPQGDIILLMGNKITALCYQDGEKVDPATWINIADYPLLQVDEWPIEVLELEYIDPALEVKAMDDILGESLPKPSKALLKFVKDSKQKKRTISANTSSSSSSQTTPPGGGIPIIVIVFLFLSIGNVIRGFYQTNKATPSSSENSHFLSSIPLIGWILIVIILISIISILRRKKYLHTVFQYIRGHVIKPATTKPQTAPTGAVEKPSKENKRQRWRAYLAKLAIFSQLHHWIKFSRGTFLV